MNIYIKIFSATISILCFFDTLSLSHASIASQALGSQGGPESVAKNSRYQSTIGTRGMVASDDPLASEWGASFLRKGGNAIDAAVATAFAMSVTRPHYAALGGGGFLVYCPKSKPNQPSVCQSLDFREVAPQGATANLFIQNGKANPLLARNGALASGVPGNVAGLLLALEKFGTQTRQKILKYPIELARNGFHWSTHAEVAALARWDAFNPEAQKIFGCSQSTRVKIQTPCPTGTLLKQKDLAQVLELISKKGANGFYKGIVAKKLIAGIQKAGGILTEKDLSSYEPKFREPLQSTFQNLHVISMGLPSSGGIALTQLLSYADHALKMGQLKSGFGEADTLHALTHAMALSFKDRADYLGDLDAKDPGTKTLIGANKLLSPTYIDEQWKSFDSNHASLPKGSTQTPEKHPHTTHLSVIDSEGNAVAMTITVNDNFGSGFIPPGTGIVMNNEMDDFSIQTGVPNLFGLVGNEANAIGPHKRPLSSMTPTIIRDQTGQVKLVIGAAGGPRIITSVFLSLINRLVFGMSLQDALSAPRFHQQWVPEEIILEKYGFANEVRTNLEKKGYHLQEVMSLGKVHALERLEDGRTSGAADPRGEGGAVAE